MFLAGACLAYYVAMPLALHFLLGYQGNIGGIQQEALPGVGNYLTFCTRFLLRLRHRVLLPMLLMMLEAAGLVTRGAARERAALRDRRDRGRGGSSADPARCGSKLLLVVPLYRVYEFAILAIRIAHWRAARRAAQSNSTVEEGARTEEGPEAPPGGEGWRFRAHLIG